jgi:hypothetical protein
MVARISVAVLTRAGRLGTPVLAAQTVDGPIPFGLPPPLEVLKEKERSRWGNVAIALA